MASIHHLQPSPFFESHVEGVDFDQIRGYIEKILNQNSNNNKMRKKYKVLKLSELAEQLGLPSSKGYKTKDYLEMVIGEIEDRGYGFVQFLQIVDALYVIIDATERKTTSGPDKFNPEEEVKNHYHPPKSAKSVKEIVEELPEKEKAWVESELEPAALTPKDKNILEGKMKKPELPWKK